MAKQSVMPYTEEQKNYRDEIEKKHGKTPEQLHDERARRIGDAMELREPDRVPAAFRLTYFPAKYLGIPKSTAYYQPGRWKHAVIRTILDFDPDQTSSFAGLTSGEVSQILKPTMLRWPGGPLPENAPHQSIDVETMMGDEYDLIMNDPTDFVIRKQLPRMYEALAPLAKLPQLSDIARGFNMITTMFTSDEFKQLGGILIAAGEAQERFEKDMGTSFREDMQKLCLLSVDSMGGGGGIPFDNLSDVLRGMKSSMLDMYRHKDQMLALFDKQQESSFKRALPADPNTGIHLRRVGAGMHRGTDGFLSKEQWETFYWPYMKKSMLKSIELGYYPVPFVEGRLDSRLEYFLDLPKGKFGMMFEATDIFRAKEILGKHCCIMGNVPSSILQVGSVDDVETYCKKCIEICGKGGGYILMHGSSLDEAKPENVKAMIDSVKKFHP